MRITECDCCGRVIGKDEQCVEVMRATSGGCYSIDVELCADCSRDIVNILKEKQCI